MWKAKRDMHPSDSVENLIVKAVRLANGQPITQIRATLGDLTGHDPDWLRAEFERQRIGTPAANASLTVRREPGRVLCLSCEHESLTYLEGEACAACGSFRRQVVGGHQLALEGVSVERSMPSVRRQSARSRAASAALSRSRAEGD
jgi:hydrogenase nickel incorporation protein HypA/HybF